MDKELLKNGELVILVKEGNLHLTLDSLGVDVSVVVDSGYFLDKLAAAIPGTVDDAVLGMLKAALKGA